MVDETRGARRAKGPGRAAVQDSQAQKRVRTDEPALLQERVRSLEVEAGQLEQLFSLSLDMLCIARTDGYFQRVNPAFQRTLGYSCDELLSRPLIEFVHPDDREKTLDVVRQLAEGIPTVRFLNRYRTKDGPYRTLQWMAMPRPEEGLIYASASDVTEQQRVQQRCQTVLELAPDPIVIADSAGKIVLVNAQTERVFGYRAEELLGQPVELLVPEHLRQSHIAHRVQYHNDLRIRGMGARPDLPARRKDGTEFLAEISLGPIHTEDDVVVVAVIRDVTERRRLEKSVHDNHVQMLAARRIQQYFLPRNAPAIPGFDIAGASYPAEFTAGDHFDYIPMAGATLGIVIGDVTGHGYGPALLMVALRNHLRALIRHHDALDEILGDANRLLSEEMEEEYFITLLMGRLDPQTRTFDYINAGHPSGYLFDASGEHKASLNSTTIPLGVLHDLNFPPAQSVALEPGDMLVLVTDGVLEAQRADGAQFGEQRTLDTIRDHHRRPAREIIAALFREARTFSGERRIADDVTAVVVKVTVG